MAADSTAIPETFTSLTSARNTKVFSDTFNVIGVCVHKLDPIKCDSGRKDYKITFTLHDPTWRSGLGMEFAFFTKQLEQLPAIIDQGDIVVLRNIKTMGHKGDIKGLSSHMSSWVVLPYTEVANINSLQDVKEKARWCQSGNGTPGRATPLLNEAELKYAKWIAEQEDPSTWPLEQGRTQADIANTMESNGGNRPAPKTKLRTLQDLEIPANKPDMFADIFGEVRKVYRNDMLTELYVTDYTTNNRLYDYRLADHQGGQPGDPYGYITQGSNAKWPGPWGQMTINVTCRDLQSHLATKVKAGDFVYLGNVHIKMGKDGRNLQGNCRNDKNYPEKELVEIVNSGDKRRDEVLRRKRAYEDKSKAEGIKFFRDPNEALSKKRQNETVQEETGRPKKKGKTRSRTERKAMLEVAEQAKKEQALYKANNNVRINNHTGISPKTIVDILDPDILNRPTVKGNQYRLPFQNCTYKAKVRVIDFFPRNIANFAAPYKESQYDVLSDHEASDEDEDSAIDLTEDCGSTEIKWEWRFCLVVEDARPQPGCTNRPTQMDLLVADTDGEFLLNMEACDLKDPTNQSTLNKLKEKLFHLWGDLQEKKEESSDTSEQLNVKPSARPFECLIKEYGVPMSAPKKGSTKFVEYERMFRLFGTSI